jgi:hypothetical protein
VTTVGTENGTTDDKCLLHLSKPIQTPKYEIDTDFQWCIGEYYASFRGAELNPNATYKWTFTKENGAVFVVYGPNPIFSFNDEITTLQYLDVTLEVDGIQVAHRTIKNQPCPTGPHHEMYVHPNPSDGYIDVSFSDNFNMSSSGTRVNIYRTSTQNLVKTQVLQLGQMRINTSGLTEGNYRIITESTAGNLSKSFIIVHQ